MEENKRRFWIILGVFLLLSSVLHLANNNFPFLRQDMKEVKSTHASDDVPSKPSLFVHVGPGKTATTSLQVDWTTARFAGCMKEDSFWYAGRYYNSTNFKNGNEGKETFSPLLHILREILIPQRARHQELTYCNNGTANCWPKFAQQLETHHAREHVMVSDEPLALRWTAKAFSFLQTIRSLKVIIGYRRLYEWLPASIYQRNRKRLRDFHWPSKGELSALQPLWPNVAVGWQRFHYIFTDHLIDEAKQAGVDHFVLNVHDHGKTLQSQFFCDGLWPYARVCCRESKVVAERKHWNSRTVTTQQKIEYDTLTTAAAAKGLIDTEKYTRTQVRRAVATNANRTWWKRLCPSEKQLHTFLTTSMDLETLYVGSGQEAEHLAGFSRKAADGFFCQLDTNAMLRQPDVVDFFTQFAS